MAFPVEIVRSQELQGLVESLVLQQNPAEDGHLPFQTLGGKTMRRHLGHAKKAPTDKGRQGGRRGVSIRTDQGNPGHPGMKKPRISRIPGPASNLYSAATTETLIVAVTPA